MSIYDKRQQLRQQQMDDDPLLKIMYGMQDVDVDAIAAHVRTYHLTETEEQALANVQRDTDATPKLFLLFFALMLINKGANVISDNSLGFSAVRLQTIDVLKALLEHEMPVHALDEQSYTSFIE